MSAIYGIAEIAQALGVDIRKVRDWREAGYLPEPTAKLKAGYVWAGEDIEWWIREHRTRKSLVIVDDLVSRPPSPEQQAAMRDWYEQHRAKGE